jgi:RHS repeat-associated protein
MAFADPDGDAGPSASSLTNRYLNGVMVDQVLADEVTDGTPGEMGDIYWPLADNLGSNRDVVRRDAVFGTEAVEHLRFDAFGKIELDTNAGYTQRQTYAGLEYDADVGLYYALHRWYDSVMHRFISEDPIGFNGGTENVHEFVNNSPTNFTDPAGLAVAGNTTFLDKTINCMAGFSDVATLGIAPGIRWLIGYDPGIDRSSGWYWGGAAAPVVVATGGAATLPSGIGAAGGTTTVFGTSAVTGTTVATTAGAGGAILSRPEVQRLIQSSGNRVITVFTRLTQMPAANRHLYTWQNQAMCDTVRKGTDFIGRIPADLFQRLIYEKQILVERTMMGGKYEDAYVISAEAMAILQQYFEASPK